MKDGPKEPAGEVRLRRRAHDLPTSARRGQAYWKQHHVSFRNARTAGFSLLELLVVIALIVILTTLFWGSNSGSKTKKLRLDCENNLQKIYTALEVFANEHELKFPEKSAARVSTEPLDVLVPRYASDNSIFICPASKDAPLPQGASLQKQTISYAYYMGRKSKEPGDVLMSDKQVDTQSKAAGQLVFSSSGRPPGNNHGKEGGNLLFCDGHVQHSPPNASVALSLPQNVVLLNP
jgi:prepilin-type N-terminal cleavage/methylation domain-containing protein/prepilin-type processing-associated H-X9-DG protein